MKASATYLEPELLNYEWRIHLLHIHRHTNMHVENAMKLLEVIREYD